MENRNWKTYLLSDISSKIGDGLHGTPKYDGNGDYYFINGNNLINGSIIFKEDTKKVTEEEFLKYRKDLNNNSVLISINGTIGNLSFYRNEKVVLGKSAAYVNLLDTVDKKFVYYNFKSKFFQNYLVDIATGTTIPNVPLKGLREYEIQLPPLPEQKAIASVLSSLDDKIDLLHQQNQTLEALAETLFRQWFIVEAKEDWEVLPLSEIAEVKNGKSFKSSDFTDNNFNSFEVVKMGHIERGGGLKLNPKKDYISREMDVKKWILNKGDIIMAMTDMKDNVVILGVPAMIDKDDHYVLNQRVARIYLKDNSKLISNYLLYIQLNNKDFIAELQTKANSGVQVNLSTEAIKESEILIPPIELQKEFGNKIIDLYSILS
ncbi:restriction endonuclease subunit S [Chryseobacterium sp. RR2-3-20]|uniref:restriction endonuclease subunit S n=1 Tax=Chryseobacterium sp. RR2-3-20 TaxID=2787626 RepID=UPI001AE02BD7|nr:restriction endonuclease subunit S [Chryseobacterium sp. RR2-3-20]